MYKGKNVAYNKNPDNNNCMFLLWREDIPCFVCVCTPVHRRKYGPYLRVPQVSARVGVVHTPGQVQLVLTVRPHILALLPHDNRRTRVLQPVNNTSRSCYHEWLCKSTHWHTSYCWRSRMQSKEEGNLMPKR